MTSKWKKVWTVIHGGKVTLCLFKYRPKISVKSQQGQAYSRALIWFCISYLIIFIGFSFKWNCM